MGSADGWDRDGMVDWQSILDRDGPVVWRTVYRLLGNRADAEDCYQETFLSALEAWRRQPVRNPRALLQRMATARALDRLRSRYRRAARGEAAAGSDGMDYERAPDPGAGPPEAAEAAELSARLREGLATLPPKQADVFSLYSLEGWSYQEIAEHLVITVDAVGVLLHRARARLRQRLADLAPDQVDKRR